MPKLCVVCLEDRAVPAVSTWDGGGANANWTTAANWVGDVAPQAGDDLVFPTDQRVSVNDFPAGTPFHSLTVTCREFQLGGNAVELAAGLHAHWNPGITVGPPLL